MDTQKKNTFSLEELVAIQTVINEELLAKLKTYAQKVLDMRKAQKEYFKARRMGLVAVADKWLKDSKDAERVVDTLTAEILASSTPGSLFP